MFFSHLFVLIYKILLFVLQGDRSQESGASFIFLLLIAVEY